MPIAGVSYNKVSFQQLLKETGNQRSDGADKSVSKDLRTFVMIISNKVFAFSHVILKITPQTIGKPQGLAVFNHFLALLGLSRNATGGFGISTLEVNSDGGHCVG